MSLIITNDIVIFLIQLLTIMGFIFLSIFTLFSYKRLKNKTLLYISIAFLIIAISIILKIIIGLIEDFILIESAYIEAIVEATQFIAAFLFFYGLKHIKSSEAGH